MAEHEIQLSTEQVEYLSDGGTVTTISSDGVTEIRVVPTDR